MGHIAGSRPILCPSINAILQAVVLLLSVLQATCKLDDGAYGIIYSGPGPCKGRSLAYPKYDNTYPGKVALSSKSTVLWEVRNLGNMEITLAAANRAKCCPAKLGYSSTCASATINLPKTGNIRWKLTTIDSKRLIYRLDAVKNRCKSSSSLFRLGPSVSPTATRCDRYPFTGVRLHRRTSATQTMYWRFILVKPAALKDETPSPSPTPLPTPTPSRPTDFCSRPTTRKVFSGRRIQSTLSGIRPCISSSPRSISTAECCAACEVEPSCVAFTFLDNGGLDCRKEGGVAASGACYLLDSYTGSYDPLEEAFGYHSSNAFLSRKPSG